MSYLSIRRGFNVRVAFFTNDVIDVAQRIWRDARKSSCTIWGEIAVGTPCVTKISRALNDHCCRPERLKKKEFKQITTAVVCNVWAYERGTVFCINIMHTLNYMLSVWHACLPASVAFSIPPKSHLLLRQLHLYLNTPPAYMQPWFTPSLPDCLRINPILSCWLPGTAFVVWTQFWPPLLTTFPVNIA